MEEIIVQGLKQNIVLVLNETRRETTREEELEKRNSAFKIYEKLMNNMGKVLFLNKFSHLFFEEVFEKIQGRRKMGSWIHVQSYLKWSLRSGYSMLQNENSKVNPNKEFIYCIKENIDVAISYLNMK